MRTAAESEEFGALLRQQRLATGLTQEALAERAGLGVRTIQDLERGAARPRADTTARLQAALGLCGEGRARFAALARPAPRHRSRITTAARGAGSGATHLPVVPTSFVGREREVAAVHRLLGAARLVTLVGPGGVGKTRLALAVTARCSTDFADGAVFVDLAPLADPADVAAALAAALGVREMPGRALPETLTDALRDRHLLLLLDNCERVAGAAPLVAALLAACPRLAALATSRLPLHLRAEQEFPVAPLATPDCGLPAAALAAFPAVALFATRARAVAPEFTVTDDNAAAVAAICAQLDGLPLAIELAAARVKLLPPGAMLARLDHRLALLTGGPRDLPARQRTLRDTIAWSHELLAATEQRVFRRLGVFSGGGTLAALAAVAADAADPDPLDAVAALVDQSLVYRGEGPDGEPRFGMLETIREYAAEQLAAHGEADASRRRHADYYLGLAEAAEARLRGGEQPAWLGRLEAEHANFQAALAWCLAAGEGARGLRLAGALGAFWHRRGHLSLGCDWLARLLAAGPSGAETAATRAKALCGLGQLAYSRMDIAAALRALEESVGLRRRQGDAGGRGLAEALTWLGAARLSADWDLLRVRAALDEAAALARAADDPWTLAGALTRLGMALLTCGDAAAAGPTLEESLALWRATGDRWGEGWALFYLGNTAELAGDAATARARYEASLDAWRAGGDVVGTAGALGYLGNLAHRAGDEAAARRHYEAGLTILRSTGNRVGVAYALGRLGGVAAAQGDAPGAARRYRESLAIFHELGYGRGLAEWLTSLADTVGAAGDGPLAARLLGAAAAQLARLGTDLFPADRADWNRTIAATRAALDPAAFAVAWDAGWAKPLEQAIAAGSSALERGGREGQRPMAHSMPF